MSLRVELFTAVDADPQGAFNKSNDYWFIIWLIVAVVIGNALLKIFNRWNRGRVFRRVMERVRHPEKYPPVRLEPESRFIVHLSEQEVICVRPDGTSERVLWNDLEKVEVITTDEGPFLPDIFWVLHGSASRCAVPQGATGQEELLRRLEALPSFDNKAFIEAQCSTSNRSFTCWQRLRCGNEKAG
jgi:hypothetical protein